ncbi:large-conductance mechanosensitive channel protein MscL [Fusobacterium massiliense]|uniref:large-conductance mechanosensitive channel protein MscL n=1 Tax=Fusobacterium massiliense TaxID=1852365 RepID=UPI00093E87D6|nr:large-conductance mechanosensitive channel protein MscL [Fusobacterium massiliense]
MKFFEEFKSFVMRGNLIDMAVGVIIGGAFGKIVTSLVNDVIMPIFGIILGNIDISSLEYKIGTPVEGVEQAAIRYGMFLQDVINFLIIAFCIFIFIKIMNKLHKKKEEAPAPPKPSNEEILLTEIRDALNNIAKK